MNDAEQSPTFNLYTCIVEHRLTAEVEISVHIFSKRQRIAYFCWVKHLKCSGWTHFLVTFNNEIPYRLFIDEKGKSFIYVTYFKSSPLLRLAHIECIINNANSKIIYVNIN